MTAPGSATWLSVSPTVGTVPGSVTSNGVEFPGPSSLAVTIDPTNLAIGTYTAAVTIATPAGGSTQVGITLQIAEAAAVGPSNADGLVIVLSEPGNGAVEIAGRPTRLQRSRCRLRFAERKLCSVRIPCHCCT